MDCALFHIPVMPSWCHFMQLSEVVDGGVIKHSLSESQNFRFCFHFLIFHMSLAVEILLCNLMAE